MVCENAILQTEKKVIKRINKELGMDAFKNFIPNYKNIATTYQFFNTQLSPKQQVLIEEQLINFLLVEDSTRNNCATVHTLLNVNTIVFNPN